MINKKEIENEIVQALLVWYEQGGPDSITADEIVKIFSSKFLGVDKYTFFKSHWGIDCVRHTPIMPLPREYCQKHGAQFQEIDLRWDVLANADDLMKTLDGKTAKLRASILSETAARIPAYA